MKKLKWIIGILLAGLCTLVSIQFYSGKGYNTLEYVLLVIENTIKTFLGNSPLKLSEVAEISLSRNEFYDKFLLLVYAIVIYLAPLFLAASVITAFTSVRVKIDEFFFKRSFRNNDRNIIIFGYNDLVKKFLENESKSGENRKIIVISKVKITSEEQIQYFKKKIWVVDINSFAENNDGIQKKFFELTSNIKYIMLFEEDALSNYSTLTSIYKYLSDNWLDKCTSKKIYCYAEDYQSRVMINNYLHSIVMTSENKNAIIDDYNVFDLSLLRARSFFKDTTNDVIKDYKKVDIHNVIVGFGRLGHAFFDEIINRSVHNQNGTIRIDILGNDINIEKNYILNRISTEYVKKVSEDHYELSSDLKANDFRCDGKLDIYFHDVVIEEKKFYNELKNIASETKAIDNVYVCTKNESVTLRTINIFSDLRVKHSELFTTNTSLYLRIENQSKFTDFSLLHNNGFDSKILPPASDALSLDVIEDSINTNIAIAYHYIYNDLSDAVYKAVESEDETNIFFDIDKVSNLKKYFEKNKLSEDSGDEDGESAVREWRKLDFIKRQATWGLVLHNTAKEKLLDNCYNRLEIKDELYALMKKRFTKQTLKKYLRDSEKSKLFDFIKIEHRRWNYSKAFEGFRYSSDGDKARFRHKCLLTYDELVNRVPDTVLYDLIPLIYILSN
ncbi:MAG: hypothetical protein IJ593_07705 [Lachnospiraceae bacterium]|nr:hypothetical protein [Lachnospiraceae bacterium]